MSHNSSQDSIRSFIAIPLLPTSVKWCEDLAASVRATFNRSGNRTVLRWVPAANLHITLVFLGSQPEAALIELATRLSAVLPTSKRFVVPALRLSGFPDAKSRILALELDSTSELLTLQQLVMAAVVEADIRLSASHDHFRPHITLARVRSGTASVSYVQALNQTQDQTQDQTLCVQSVVLFESINGAQGVYYRARSSFELCE